MMREVTEQLAEIQQQQKASAENLAHLVHQYEGWQASLDSILARIDTLQLQGEEPARNLEYPQITRTPRLPMLSGDPDSDARMSDYEVAPAEVRFEDSGKVQESASTSSQQQGDVLHSLIQSSQQKSETSNKLKRLVEQGLNDHMAKSSQRVLSMHEKIASMVNSSAFEYAAGFVILANLVVIGIEAQLSIDMVPMEFPPLSWPWWLERIFLLIYCFEIILRIVAGGRKIFRDVWFLMDLALVCVGWMALLFLPLAGVDALAAEKLLIVRGLRLLRLVRALRMINHFKVIWRLVYGLLTAGQTIFSTTALILISLFVCSCVAVELIGKDNDLLDGPETGPIVRTYFRGIDRALITLIQFVTLDSVAAIYFPLILVKPWLSIFFLGLIVVISIGLMNLVTAAVLENAMQAAVQDAEAEKNAMMETVKDAIPELLKIFQSIDKDGSGILTHDEVVTVDVDILPKKFLQTVHVNSMVELFDYLDVDHTRELTKEEFIEGLLDLCLRDMPLHMVQMLKLLHIILTISKKIDLNIEALRAHQSLGWSNQPSDKPLKEGL
ncbi:Catsper1 [Symbiodinium pilosum]|uniref:Catsper1 protein n=1 Tax=Symbiodinium pilosum TaxID=2952 RepID=A0A812XH15_SYMPI|nr:Catsper1 [Symbiodinium pilosum]